ncbi:unnamed protein product, partial [Meganyctiphanes norvegica]
MSRTRILFLIALAITANEVSSASNRDYVEATPTTVKTETTPTTSDTTPTTSETTPTTSETTPSTTETTPSTTETTQSTTETTTPAVTPEPVYNITGLKVSNASPCSLSVSWSSKCTSKCSYDVTYTGTSSGSESTTNPKMEITGLSGGSYSICVVSTTDKQNGTTASVNGTVAQVAPGKVQNVALTENPRDIIVTWTPAKNLNCTAATTGYIMTLQETANATSKQTFNVPASSTNYTFDKLEPCTEYTVSAEIISDVANTSYANKTVSTSVEDISKTLVLVKKISSIKIEALQTFVNIARADQIVQYKVMGNVYTSDTESSDGFRILRAQLCIYANNRPKLRGIATLLPTFLNNSLKIKIISVVHVICSIFNDHTLNGGCCWCPPVFEFPLAFFFWRCVFSCCVKINTESCFFFLLPLQNQDFFVSFFIRNRFNTKIRPKKSPGKVQNVSFVENSSMVTVMWAPATILKCTAAAKEYMITLQKSTNASVNQTVNLASNVTSYTFKKLEPCTEYTMSAEIISDVKNITSDSKTVSTSIEAPPKPVVTADDVSPDTLHVNWTVSGVSNCNISNYIVTLGVVASNKTSKMTLSSNVSEFSIGNLTESSAYTVSVTAESTYENSTLTSESSTSDVSTCGPTVSLNHTKQDMCSFLLTWENSCPQSYNYTVTWKGALNGSINTANTNQSFANLPTGDYDLCVSSTWNSTMSKCLKTSIVPEAPGKVQKVTFSQTSRNLTVTWAPGKIYNCTAATKGYMLSLQKSSNVSIKQFITVPSNTTKYTFKDLEPCTDYIVLVGAMSEKANGSSSNMTVSTSVEAPAKPTVTVDGTSPGTLHVNWTAGISNCSITGYMVKWGDVASNTTSNITLAANMTDYIIVNLSDTAEYTVSVTAVSSYGNVSLWSEPSSMNVSSCGPVISLNRTKQMSCGFMLSWKNSCTQSFNYTVSWQGALNGSANTNTTGQTFMNIPIGDYKMCVNSTWNSKDFKRCLNTSIGQEAPGAVQNITFLKNSRVLTVAWSPSKDYDCTATTKGYSLTLQKSANVSDNKTIKVPSNKTDYTFEKLEPCTGYTVSVEIMSDVGNTSSENKNVSTSIEAPGKPKTTTSQASSDSILVKWKQPMANPCPIHHYDVSWKVKNSTAEKDKQVTSTSYTIKGLKHKTTYGINVTAVVSYQNKTASTSSLEVQESTGGGSSISANIVLFNIIAIAFLNKCLSSVLIQI